ncbi:MAG TPA: ATP-dependent DNA helicase RecG [Mycobacteriales bacterium]|nr:ATP-dependent DNA helicase RecG [Mycobacteriales bacterium]
MVRMSDRVSLIAAKLAKPLADDLGIRTVGDLLRHYPRRYAKRGELTAFSELAVGEHVTVVAEVRKIEGRQLREKLHKTDVVIADDAGRTMAVTFFNKAWIKRDLLPGRQAMFSGRVERFKGKVQLAQPDCLLMNNKAGVTLEDFAGALLPIYPASARLNSLILTRLIESALKEIDLDGDPLPDALRAAHSLLPFREALEGIHRPKERAQITAATNRLTWDEAFVLQVTLAQRRAALRKTPGIPRVRRPGGLLDAFDATLPFTLTQGQREVGEVLTAELAQAHPMNRLLQGEVGSGKTVVALRAMLAVVDAGGQAALLAPTEVLAQQHLQSLRALLGPLGCGGELGAAEHATQIALLTGSQGAAARRTALAAAASGEAGLVVGTHALLSEGVAFADLGLVVVDEQHRFGVEQRDILRGKGAKPPHVLVMTATPIPRTVAMTVYGDLEVSTLTELPGGRAEIRSAVVPVVEKPAWLDTAWQRIREAAAEGRQAFVVCPRIGGDTAAGEDAPEPAEEAEATRARRPAVAVEDLLPALAEGPLAGLRVQPLHGRLPTETKEATMRSFAAGEIDVLVATTVVEVGVDVPNATVRVVMDADRFGISQLHQLRGRVGRGAHGGLCLLVTESEPGSPSRERLDAVAATQDGFRLAQVDLEQRREGDVLGASQSGRRSSLRLLRLLHHEDLIRTARGEATDLVEADPTLAGHPVLAQAVADLADAERADYLEKA